MQHLFLLLPILFFFIHSPIAQASDIANTNMMGAGIGAGSTSLGLTAKQYLQPDKAVQLFLGSGGGGIYNRYASFAVEGLQEMTYREMDYGRFFWGYGAGAGIYAYRGYNVNQSSISIEAILEGGVHFHEAPLEIILDLRPTFFLGNYGYNGLYLLNLGGAIRYYL
jgi:hypothetical protein